MDVKMPEPNTLLTDKKFCSKYLYQAYVHKILSKKLIRGARFLGTQESNRCQLRRHGSCLSSQ